MKELYEIPEFKLSVFDIEDIVTAGLSGDAEDTTTEGGDFDGDDD